MYAKKCLELARTKYPNNENLRVAYMLGLNDGYSQGEEDLIEKACDAYCKVCGHYPHTVPIHICRHDCDYFSNFKEAMKGDKL